MTISSSKNYHIIFSCSLSILFVLSAYIGFDAGSLWAAFLFGPIIVFLIYEWIIVGRKLIMDETGCTIRFCFFSRFYAWNDLTTKKIVYFYDAFRYREPYISGVIFSSKRRELPRKLTPFIYNTFNNPFEFFFVYFDPQVHNQRAAYKCDDIYVVDKFQFIAAMKEWGVELDEAIQ